MEWNPNNTFEDPLDDSFPLNSYISNNPITNVQETDPLSFPLVVDDHIPSQFPLPTSEYPEVDIPLLPSDSTIPLESIQTSKPRTLSYLI